MMSEAVHLDGANIAFSIRWGKGKSRAPAEWERLKSVVDYFREHDVEVHIHCPAWAKCQFDDLVEEGLDDYVVLHWVDIPDYDTERDDKDLLAWALLTNGYIVSNDMMQNHIENGSIKLEWFAIRRIPYHFTKIGEFRPKLPTEFPLPRRKEND
jgi:hypothetical protein